jgi:hypothetical protein
VGQVHVSVRACMIKAGDLRVNIIITKISHGIHVNSTTIIALAREARR